MNIRILLLVSFALAPILIIGQHVASTTNVIAVHKRKNTQPAVTESLAKTNKYTQPDGWQQLVGGISKSPLDDPFLTDPESYDVTLATGEKKILPLSFTNNSTWAFGWQVEAEKLMPLQVLGWQYGSTPLGDDDGILGASPDWAMFIKEITVNAPFNQAILRLGFDDGIRVWVNGNLVLSDIQTDHGVDYWNQEIDISQWLVQGNNRIAAVVFNGVFQGGGIGGFDCELDLDGLLLIKRGDLNPYLPEAMWFYYGETGQRHEPPKDIKERNWWEKDYGCYQWVLLNQYQDNKSGDEFLQLGWNYWSAPFGEDEFLLNESPDNAYFIKDIELPAFQEATMFLSFDDGCLVYINGNLAFDYQYDVHGHDYWNQELDVSQLLVQGRNRISIVVFNGVYGGGGSGYFDCHLVVDGADVIKRGDVYSGQPEAMWNVFGQVGAVTFPPVDSQGRAWFVSDYALATQPLGSLGWNYMSAPFGENEYLLNNPPDNAYFIKDVELSAFEEATLFLSFDDGCLVYINGNLAFDHQYDFHGLDYWNIIHDVTNLLIEGRNRISIVVFNGVYGGGGSGYFDCQLTVDGEDVIKRGNDFPGHPGAFWYFYGQVGVVSVPPADLQGRLWYAFRYGMMDPILNVAGWQYNSTPVNENENLLYNAPDNAQFIKDVVIGNFSDATLYLAFDDGCRVWINGVLEFDFHEEIHPINYWNQVVELSGLLQPGRNRIAIEVYNGVYQGGAFGGFDCQLIVDNEEIIKRGDLHNGQPEAMWFMYGESGKILVPPTDINGLKWYHRDYGLAEGPPSRAIQGIINAWETLQVKVLIDASGLVAGDYSTTIRVTNTGTMEVTEVPVTLHVLGGVDVNVYPASLDFGDYYIGFPETKIIQITNHGDDTLEILDIYSRNVYTTIIWDLNHILPGKSIYPKVTIQPSQPGEYNSCVIIKSDDPQNSDWFVPVSAVVKNAPDIDIPNLEYLFAILEPGQTEIQHVPIYNVGDNPSVLDFTIPQEAGGKTTTGLAGKATPDIRLKNIPMQMNYFRINRKPAYHDGSAISGDRTVKDPSELNGSGNEIVIFYDNMENGVNGWTIEKYAETATQWHLADFNSASPDHAWWCGNELTGTYYNGGVVFEGIISPPILLPNYGNTVYLEFNEFYEVEEGYDQLHVDISIDGGENWNRIREFASGNSGGWVTTTLDISDYSQHQILIKFLFNTGDDVANNFPGWFVDDVKVYTSSFPFISITPNQGSLQSSEYQLMTVEFDAAGYEPGLHVGYFLIRTNDPDEPVYYLHAHMLVNEPGIPTVLTLQYETVFSGNEKCYDAYETIIVAGDGTYFVVEPNATARFISGGNILFREGTHLQQGCYVHAYIDLEENFCNYPHSVANASYHEVVPDQLLNKTLSDERFYKIYPNPTDGLLTIEIQENNENQPLIIEIFNTLGICILNINLPATNHHVFDLTAQQPGIYFIRVLKNNNLGTVRIIKK